MIRIRHKDLERIVEAHARAIERYVINKSKYKKVCNEIIEFLPEFDLGIVLRARPDELAALALKWCKSMSDRGVELTHLSTIKNKKKELLNSDIERSLSSICTYLDTLYGYLGRADKFETKYQANKMRPYNSRYLIELLEIKVCPYCNRNYIYNAGDRRASELDHFFPKSSYPFLALSFYNLIPSCKVCNNVKGFSELLHNPYSISKLPERIRFKLKIKGVGFYHRSADFRIYVDGDDLNREDIDIIRNHIRTLRLNEHYYEHKDIVLELIPKSVTYSDSYIDELFRQYEGTLFKNREDVLRHVYGNYVDAADDHRRPLAKLVRDISAALEE